MLALARRAALLWAVALGFLLAPVAQAEEDPPLAYQVQQGDTLYGLNGRYFSGHDAVRQVQRFNKVTDPRRLRIGSTLLIPRELAKFDAVQLRVQRFSGPVQIGGAPAKLGIALIEGGEVSTGANGFVSFRSAGGAQISMPSSSRARLIRARRYVIGNTLDLDFEVLGGRGEASAPKLREQERFRLRTPAAVTAVRGTEFRSAHDAASGRSITEVVEGTVSVESGGDTALTDAGFGIATTANGLGEKEALLPVLEIIDPGAIQTAPEVGFSVETPAGATGFRAQIARDAGFVDVIAERIEQDGVAEFDGIDDGRYFVRARAISAQGIEGLSETYSFRRKRLGVTPSVEPSPLADGFLFAWLPDGEGKSYFAFQLWQQGRPDAMLVDEVGLEGSGMVVSGLDPAVYEWRVAVMQADKEDGMIKVWAPIQKLTVAD